MQSPEGISLLAQATLQQEKKAREILQNLDIYHIPNIERVMESGTVYDIANEIAGRLLDSQPVGD